MNPLSPAQAGFASDSRGLSPHGQLGIPVSCLNNHQGRLASTYATLVAAPLWVVFETMEGATMDIKQLTDRINQFVTDKGWYAADSIFPQTPRNIAISVAVEAAELLEHFQFSELPSDIGELAGELADVANYLFQLAYLLDIDLEQAILAKLEQNYGRTWQ